MKPLLTCLALALLCSLTAQDRVILTGLLDGTGPGATPRAIELYVQGTVDLAGYTIDRYANGATEDPTGIQLTGTFTDAFVYVVNGEAAFAEAFGTTGDFANVIPSGNVSGNGNDVFALADGGTIVDVVGGAIGDDASIYADSYLYRLDQTGPDAAWTPANWTIPGNDVLDNLSPVEIGETVPFGTYTVGAPRPAVTVEPLEPLREDGSDIASGFQLSLTTAADATVTITYALSGTATAGVDYELPDSDTLQFSAGDNQLTVSIAPLDDELIEGTETIILTVLTVSDSNYLTGASATLELIDDDLTAEDTIGIHTVQGSTDLSPLAGNVVTVQAVVTGVFQDGLGGFYLQEEDADADRDSTTSEGLFIYAPDFDATVGDLVTVTGLVEEYFGQTQIRGGDAGATITLDASAVGLPAAVSLTLPRADSSFEALEGMRVAPADLIITDVSGLARFGEVTVTSGERLIQFTECNVPDAAALAAYTDSLANDQLVIDDGRSGTNLFPILLPTGDTLTAETGFRAGERITGLTGILGYGFDRYRIQPTETGGVVLEGNARPTRAPEVGGNLKVVSANVLNYFTTLGSRGADTEGELLRQEDKIVAALCELDADIIGLNEIENNDNAALSRLVDTLSVRCGHPYAFVVSPDPGDDDIMVALIYRKDRVEETGAASSLTEPADLFIGAGSNRVPLVQTFRITDPSNLNAGEALTVCVNHLKSKGGGCGVGDDDDGGAGNCNGTRAEGARAIVQWLSSNPTGVEEEDILVIGDLNSYRMEEPIQAFLAAGFENTKTLFAPGRFPCGGGPPSYAFEGQWGSLDYALASPTLARHVTGATAWTVNAPEPSILDYNTEGNSDTLYAPDFYRFSDHDPVVVGIDFDQLELPDGIRPSGRSGSTVELQRSGRYVYTFTGLTGSGNYLLTTVGGQLLREGPVAPWGGTVSVAGLPTGIYFIVLREPGVGQAAFKVVVP